MYTLQLSDFISVDIGVGDLFIYITENAYIVKEVKKDYRPPLNEYTVEILSFYSKKHYAIRRDNGYYWWEEIKY